MKSEERGLSRKHIIESVKASLQRLQLSYVDIVIIYKADPMCPMEGESRMHICRCRSLLFFFFRSLSSVKCVCVSYTVTMMLLCDPFYLQMKCVEIENDAISFTMVWYCLRDLSHHRNKRRKNNIDLHKLFFPFCTEIVRTMTYIIQEGWTMYWGTSRWSHCEVIFSIVHDFHSK